MKNIGSKVGIFLVIICSILIVCWMGICVYDYLHKDKPKFCLDESRKLYTDGYVYSCTGLGYKIYNWGSGTNTTDTGCQFAILEADVTDGIGAIQNQPG